MTTDRVSTDVYMVNFPLMDTSAATNIAKQIVGQGFAVRFYEFISSLPRIDDIHRNRLAWSNGCWLILYPHERISAGEVLERIRPILPDNARYFSGADLSDLLMDGKQEL